MYHLSQKKLSFSKSFSNFALDMANKRITIHDKTFEITIPEATIQEAVKSVAASLKTDYADKNPVFVVVLNGAFMFAADLFRMTDYQCTITFAKVSSYDGTSSCGTISEQLPVSEAVAGRHVVIVEDIIERGYTMEYIVNRVLSLQPASVAICALSFKPEKLEVPRIKDRIRYTGMELPEAFIVGYGLDYNQCGRHLRDIYSLTEEG